MRILDWGKKKREFTGVAFSPDGTLVTAGGGYEQTCVWEVTTGAERGRFERATNYLQPVQFHPLSGHLLVPTNAGLKVRDAATGAPVGVFASGLHIGPLTFDAAGEWVVCGHQTETRQSVLSAFRWSGATGETFLWRTTLGDVPDESGCAHHLACLGDGERFVSAEYVIGKHYLNSRYRLAIRSREDGRLLQSVGKIFGYGDRVYGTHLIDAIVVMDGKSLRIHSTNDLTAASRVLKNDNRKHFTGIAFHPSGRFLAATSNDATVKFYDTTTWEVARTFTWEIGRMRSIAFSPDGTLAAAGSDKGKVVVWDVDL